MTDEVAEETAAEAIEVIEEISEARLETALVGKIPPIAELAADRTSEEADEMAEETMLEAEGIIMDIEPDCMTLDAAVVPFRMASSKKAKKNGSAAVLLLAQILEKSLTVDTGAVALVSVSLM